jgi:hypothetical protein
MARFPVPEAATATNNPSSGAQVTEYHWLSAAETLAVQVIPSGEVMTLFPVPEFATATNNPSSLAQVTDLQLLSAAEALVDKLLIAQTGLVNSGFL